MKQLVVPNKAQHKYVIGIDFGHGETSAAICELEWDKDAGHRESNYLDLDMNRQGRKKVIPSAICAVEDKFYVGEDAFSHMSDNAGIRVSFKSAPQFLDGKDEQLMMRFMKEVYANILSADDRLTKTNHIVYIARPSGWNDEATKETYQQMALEAGIPLGGLMSESRAAIFYARNPKVGFLNNITKGALVFDLGSSTLDLTYLSDSDNKPIDQGDNDGASKIEEAIYEEYIRPSVEDFLIQYPVFEDALKFKARKCKEEAYSKSQDTPTDGSFKLRSILPRDSEVVQKYGRVDIDLYIENIDVLNQLIEERKSYISDIRTHLVKYRDKEIPGRKVYGVFLTGGASRMAFLRPIIAEVFGLDMESQVKCDPDNPSLTISRGIALLGATDAITSVLVKRLKESTSEFISDSKLFTLLVEKLAENVSEGAWNVVEDTCNDWIKNGHTTSRKELKKNIEQKMTIFQSGRLYTIVNDTLKSFILNEQEYIRKEMNTIISKYAPGREITISGYVSLGKQDAITDSLRDMITIIKAIDKSIKDNIADILWGTLAVVLRRLLAIPYYLFKQIFTRDESKRKDKAKTILDKKLSIILNIRCSIKDKLKTNIKFKSQVTDVLKTYFNNTIDDNLKKVKIPIE